MSKGDNRRPEAVKGAFEQNTPFKAPDAKPCKCGSKKLRTILGKGTFCMACNARQETNE